MIDYMKARGGTIGRGTALQAGESRFWFPIVPLEFFIIITLPAAYGNWVYTATNRNEYQEYFLGRKAAGA